MKRLQRLWAARHVIVTAPVMYYQRRLRWVVPSACGLEPTCSDYTIAVVRTQGLVRGTLAAIKRLRRCGPGAVGFDPVPNKHLT